MLNWKKDSWEDVKMLLDELEFDYQCDFEGNLILHFENFNITNEKTKEVVDTVDHMWLKFKFYTEGKNYDIQFYRQDVYNSNPDYRHPHVNGSGGSNCTGDYVTQVSLPRDLLYYSSYVKNYNPGEGWTTIPSSSSLSVDTDSLNNSLIPTFYMDITLGYPVLENVELDGDIEKFITTKALSSPKTFYWKNKAHTQYSKGSRIEHINLKQYFDYAKFFERYSDATSTVSNANLVSEAQ